MTVGSFGREIVEENWPSVRKFLEISGVAPYHGSIEDGLNALYNDYIRLRALEKRGGKPYVSRQGDRRVSFESRSGSVPAGTDVHIVRTMEDVARNRFGKLNEDQREVLAQAQANIRRDMSANGFRSGKDRRKNAW